MKAEYTMLNVLVNGIIKENPTFVLMLGMCPTLASHHICNQRYRNGTYHNGRFWQHPTL